MLVFKYIRSMNLARFLGEIIPFSIGDSPM